jgi:hypothetical protein
VDAESALAQRALHFGEPGSLVTGNAVDCCLTRTYSASPWRMTAPRPGKPNATSPGTVAGIAPACGILAEQEHGRVADKTDELAQAG